MLETNRGDGGLAESAAAGLAALPVLFNLLSVATVISIIFKTNFYFGYVVLVLIVQISFVSFYLARKSKKKKILNEFKHISKSKQWVLGILSFIYVVLSFLLLLYVGSYKQIH